MSLLERFDFLQKELGRKIGRHGKHTVREIDFRNYCAVRRTAALKLAGTEPLKENRQLFFNISAVKRIRKSLFRIKIDFRRGKMVFS